MGRRVRRVSLLAALAVAPAAAAELHPVALRILGQPKPFANGLNLVEGRELAGPQGLALDLSVSPPHLYVSDTGNHRVLAWRDATRFSSGDRADLVIGQPDFYGAAANGPGLALGLSQPAGLAVDAAGHLFIADAGNHRVLRYRQPFRQFIRAPDLVVGQSSLSTRERNLGLAFANQFSLASPAAVALNARGDLAVADSGNHRVLIYTASALVADGQAADAVLGQLAFSDAAAGTGLANLSAPGGLAFDSTGRLWIADTGSNRVLQFPAALATGALPLRVIAGNLDNAARGPNTLLRPAALAFSGDDLFVSDAGNHRLLRYSSAARSAEPRPVADAVFGQPDFAAALPNGASRSLPLAAAHSLRSPAQLAFGPQQELFLADAGNHRVLAIPSSAGRHVAAARVLGQDSLTHNAPNLVEGREVSTANLLRGPAGLFPASGAIAIDVHSNPPHAYVADAVNHRVLGWRDARALREGLRADLAIGQPDLATAVANFGAALPEFRPAGPANLNRPSGLALDSSGNLYVADTGNHRVLRFPLPFEQPRSELRADLVIGQPSLAGSPIEGAASYLLQQPTGLAVHPERGDLLVADTLNNRVLLFPAPLATGMAASRVFGQTSFAESSRGLSAAALSLPTGVAFDAAGHAYVADTGNSRILVFGPLADLPAAGAAALATGAAPIGQPDFVTSLGATAPNRLRNPTALWVDPATGAIWVADTGNHRVLRFPPLAVLANNGGSAYASGGLFGQANFTNRAVNFGAASGQASAEGLNLPNAIALDPWGNLLVGDANARVALYFPQAVAVSAATQLAGAPLAPGMLASLFGPELAEETSAAALPLPLSMGSAQVLVNGAAAPLLYVSPGQINFQAPSTLAPGTWARLEVVHAASGRAVAGGGFLVAPAAAGIFAVLNEDGSLNSPANAASRGAVVQIFATGQGAVSHVPPDGYAASASPLAETPSRPLVTIGTSSERDVAPEFSGLAPGFAGLWQINARVPAPTVPAPRVPLVVRYAGSASNVVFIAVK